MTKYSTDPENHSHVVFMFSRLSLVSYLAHYPSRNSYARTYRYSVRAPQLRLQSSRKCPRDTWLIRIIHAHDADQDPSSRKEAAQKEETLPGRKVRILVRGEHAEDIVVFVHGFAVVAPLLLVPPVAVGVAELAFLWDWIDIAAILRG